MKKSLLIIVYFGDITPSVKLSITSLLQNNINILLVTDDVNFGMKHSDLSSCFLNREDFSILVNEKLNVHQNFERSYKLCDFKPFYYKILEDYISKKYDYIGFCDVDVLFGDVTSFLLPSYGQSYDVIGSRGHFMLFSMKFLKYFSLDMIPAGRVKGVANTVLQSPRNFAFDEFSFLHVYLKKRCDAGQFKWDTEFSKEVLDISYYHKEVYCNSRREYINLIDFHKGGIFIVIGEVKIEVPYVHFQKRVMPLSFSMIYCNKEASIDKMGYFLNIAKKRIVSKLFFESIFMKKLYSLRFRKELCQK